MKAYVDAVGTGFGFIETESKILDPYRESTERNEGIMFEDFVGRTRVR